MCYLFQRLLRQGKDPGDKRLNSRKGGKERRQERTRKLEKLLEDAGSTGLKIEEAMEALNTTCYTAYRTMKNELDCEKVNNRYVLKKFL